MSFNPNEYPKNFREADAIDREEYGKELWEQEQRMEAYDAGLVSFGAAVEGGARYERELAEGALELRENGTDPAALIEAFGSEHIACPVIEALNTWRRAITIAQKAA